MSVAVDIFAAEARLGRLEEELFDLCQSVLGYFLLEDIHYDASDASLEIFGMPAGRRLSDNELATFWRAGFEKLWTHEHKTHTRQPGERFYEPASMEATP